MMPLTSSQVLAQKLLQVSVALQVETDCFKEEHMDCSVDVC